MSHSSNGRKWSDPIQISTEGDCKDDDSSPSGAITAASADGKNVYIVWSSQGKIYIDRSMDGGGTWLSNDILIADQAGGWKLNVPGVNRYSGLPTLVCDNTKKGKLSGVLYLVYSDQRHGEDDTDVWFMRSVNHGDNWTQAVQISAGEKGKHQYFPQVTVDPSTGYVYILYYDRSKYDDLQTDVYLAYSMDGGSNFANVKISEQPFVADAQVPIGEGLSIAANDGTIIPVWTRSDNGKSSVWTAVIKHEELEKAK